MGMATPSFFVSPATDDNYTIHGAEQAIISGWSETCKEASIDKNLKDHPARNRARVPVSLTVVRETAQRNTRRSRLKIIRTTPRRKSASYNRSMSNAGNEFPADSPSFFALTRDELHS